MLNIYPLVKPGKLTEWCIGDGGITVQYIGNFEDTVKAHLRTHPRDFVAGDSYILINYGEYGRGMLFTITEDGEFQRGVGIQTQTANARTQHRWPPRP